MNRKPEAFSEIIEGLHSLRTVAPRDPQRAKAGRVRFLAQAQALQPKTTTFSLAPQRGHGWRWNLGRALAALVLALTATGTGVGLAAQSALPSDGLYSAKLGIEQFRLALAPNEVAGAHLQLEFLRTRAGEIQQLLEQGRQGDLTIAASLYRDRLLAVSELIFGYQDRGDPSGESLLQQLLELLAEQQAFFTRLLEDYPELAQTDLGKLFGLVESLNEIEQHEEQGRPSASLAGITPGRGAQGRVVSVTIQGSETHFSDDSLVYFEPTAGLSVRSVHAFNEGALFVSISIAPNARLGEVSVWVQSGDEIARGVSFSIVALGDGSEGDGDSSAGEDGQEEAEKEQEGEETEHEEEHEEEQEGGEDNEGAGEEEHEDNSGSSNEDEPEDSDHEEEHSDDEEHSDHGEDDA